MGDADSKEELIIYQAKDLCERFINKVNIGMARSRETYGQCKKLLEKIKEWENS
jgi:hypothetical protein